jgi:CRP-like cAMP-binding protein
MLHPDKINFYLKLFPDMGLHDLQSLFNLARVQTLVAGEIYIREGELSKKLAYVKEGLIRAYHVNERGDERTLLLRWEDQFLSSHDNLFFHKPSRFVYQALENTTLLVADFDAIQALIATNNVLESSRYYFVLNMLANSMQRVESFVLLNPEERYQQLVQEKTDIVQRVPGKYLASLLGITPVSLSRIRKRIAVKQKR